MKEDDIERKKSLELSEKEKVQCVLNMIDDAYDEGIEETNDLGEYEMCYYRRAFLTEIISALKSKDGIDFISKKIDIDKLFKSSDTNVIRSIIEMTKDNKKYFTTFRNSSSNLDFAMGKTNKFNGVKKWIASYRDK